MGLIDTIAVDVAFTAKGRTRITRMRWERVVDEYSSGSALGGRARP
jgi:hypothetical protein